MIDKQRLRPIAFDGLVRVGNHVADGGYVVPEDALNNAAVVLSLGMGYEWKFDDQVRTRNRRATMIAVDHTIKPSWFLYAWVRSLFKKTIYRALGNNTRAEHYRELHELATTYFRLFRSRIAHVRKRVAAVDGPNDISLSTLIAMGKSQAPCSVFLKMDIEGSEYDIIPHICENATLISVVTAEFHDLASAPEQFNIGVSRLQEHFHIVHIHGNNHAPYSVEFDFPDVVEITFVNKGLCPAEISPSLRSYPDPVLDVPNKHGSVDYPLRFT